MVLLPRRNVAMCGDILLFFFLSQLWGRGGEVTTAAWRAVWWKESKPAQLSPQGQSILQEYSTEMGGVREEGLWISPWGYCLLWEDLDHLCQESLGKSQSFRPICLPCLIQEGSPLLRFLETKWKILPDGRLRNHVDKCLMINSWYYWNMKGLPWWSNGWDSVLPMQKTGVRSLVRELDPTCCN